LEKDYILMRFKTGILFLFFAITAVADDMIVTTKGESFRISKSVEKGTNLLCTAQDGGTTHTIALDQIKAIIPIVTPGKKYTIENVTQALAKIDAAKLRFKSMVRKINVVQTEWIALKTSLSSDIGPELDTITTQFRRSKTDKSYSKALMDLGMLQYKHKANVINNAAIEAAIKQLQTSFLGFDLDDYTERCSNANITLNEYKELRTAALTAINKTPLTDERNAITKALTTARGTLLARDIPFPRSTFKKRHTIAAYFSGLAFLNKLSDELATTAAENKAISNELGLFKKEVSKRLSVDLSFNDFPLTKSDVHLKETLAPFCSSTTFLHIKTPKEKVFVIPRKEPVVAPGMRGKVVMPFSVTANCLPEKGTEQGIMIATGTTKKKLRKHYIPMPHMRYKDGRASVPFRYNLQKTGKDSVPIRDKDGKHFLLYIVQRPTDKRGDNSAWTPISLACRIPVQEEIKPEIPEMPAQADDSMVVTASRTGKNTTLNIVNTGVAPRSSSDSAIPHWSSAPYKGKNQWIHIDMGEVKLLNSFSVYWLHDNNDINVPAHWYLQSRLSPNEEWTRISATGRTRYSLEKDAFNKTVPPKAWSTRYIRMLTMPQDEDHCIGILAIKIDAVTSTREVAFKRP
jgi:hypothetical protein